MEILITKQEDISLSELVTKQKEGFSVMRSAHVGNARLYNQVIAAVGIRMLLVDHNVTGLDTNYFPGLLIQDQSCLELAPKGQVSMRTPVVNPITGENQFLDELHKESLSKLFPDTEIITNTSYLRENESVVSDIVTVCAEEMPELFNRVIPAGDVSTIKTTRVRKIGTDEVLQLTDDPRKDAGVLIPNAVDILVNFILESYISEKEVQYHISGPDMVKYINGLIPTLERLGKAVLSRCGFATKLPNKIEVQLVPGIELKIASSNLGKAAVDNLVNAVVERRAITSEIQKSKKEFFGSSQSSNDELRQKLLASTAKLDRDSIQLLVNSALDCPDHLDDGNGIPVTTQYDSLNAGGVYVPEVVKELTMRELKSINSQIKKAIQTGFSP